jgi:hypothetical protein
MSADSVIVIQLSAIIMILLVMLMTMWEKK